MPNFSPTNPVRSDDTLTTFLCHAVAANRSEHKTLTLVLPESIALQPAFFCDLATTWRELRSKISLGADIMLRVDCCSDESRSGMLRGCAERLQQWRSERAIDRQNLREVISLTRCLVVGRPSREPLTIVMGIADPSVSFPEWVKPVEISLPYFSKAA